MARRISRGDIWLYRFAKPDKRRPVLVISRQEAIDVLTTVMVAPITSTRHGLVTEVEVRFEPAERGTRVTLEHRGWDRVPLENASRHDRRAYAGRLDELKAIAARPELSGPVLIVIGEVVALGAIGTKPAALAELAA